MAFQLVDAGWNRILNRAVAARRSPLRIICPFIKTRVAERLLRGARTELVQVITRFNLGNFYDGVSDTEALRLFMDNGAHIRGVRNLHAKLYLFGQERVIVTSANLTDAALLHNHEFGFVTDEPKIIGRCEEYFVNLWQQACPDLTASMLDNWDRDLTEARIGRTQAAAPELPDYGAKCGLAASPIIVPPVFSDAPKAFVKFFGVSDNRAEHSMAVLEEVRRAGCHWACTYPKGKRPRQVEDGSVLFIGRLVKAPGDTMIFGRAVGLRYQDGRDDASTLDIERRSWKAKWPHYIRVHHPEFVAGTLANGISLAELMDELGSNAFESTRRNLARGTGNTHPGTCQ